MMQLFFFRTSTLFGITAILALTLSAPVGAQTPAISQIQGSAESSPQVGQNVALEGVVTANFRDSNQLSGFFLQDTQGDGDEATSDGIFVYVNARSNAAGIAVKVGDRVRVSGRVEEFHGQTQIGRVSGLEILGAENAPAPTTINFPLPPGVSLEQFEGMLVTFPQQLTVSAQNELPRYGALTVSLGRLFVPTNEKPLAQKTEAGAIRSLLLDDGSSAQSPKPVPYLDEMGTRRTGSTVANLTGILSFDFDKYRLQPTIAPTFENSNPRPLLPPTVGGTVTVAAANVQNYWTTLQNAAHPEARGSKTAAEFRRQSAKIVAELKGLDADVVALMELESNGAVAIGDLVEKLNAAYGGPIYAAVSESPQGGGPGPIKVGLIYKTARVTLRGAATSANDAVFDRFPLAQTFVSRKNGAVFTVVVNHFKSKGSAPETGDIDLGEGAWNQKRLQQAQKLLEFIKKLQLSSGDSDVLSLGDYNAYIEESPMIKLRASGLRHLNLRLSPEERYSYGYDGRFGSLDHALTTASLEKQVTGFGEWHINADEPYFLGYSYLRIKDFVATPFRASDHDPLLIGLNLTAPPISKPITTPVIQKKKIPIKKRAKAVSIPKTSKWKLKK